METTGLAGSDAHTLADLEARVQVLEESLNKTRASAVILRARLLAEGLSPETGPAAPQAALPEPLPFAGDIPEADAAEPEAAPLPRVTLPNLPPQHYLRLKWRLEKELPRPSHDGVGTDDSPHTAAKHEGSLRLFGLHDDGSPWECSILYSRLMDVNGITIGREEPDSDIVLNDPSISRRHLRLSLTDDGVMVEDEDSTNGTFVNNKRLNAYQRRTTLSDGDILKVADIELKVELL